MTGYIYCFLFTILFAFLSDKMFIHSKRKIGVLFFILSLLIPCFIAGVRSLEVGADVKSYFLVLYNCYTKGMSLFEGMKIANVEFGYSLTMFIASKTNNVNVALFVNQLLISLPIYLVAYDLRKKDKYNNRYILTFVVIIYLMTFYSLSMNLLRQSIAISFIVYSYYNYINNNYKKALLFFLISCSFHISSIIGILIFIIDFICKKCKKNRIIYLFIMFTLLIAFVIGFKKILMLFPIKYSYYIGSKYDNSSFSLLSIIKKLFWIVPSFIYLGRISEKTNDHYSQFLAYAVILIIDFVLYFMSFQLSSAGRLGYFFLYVGYFFIIPELANMFKRKGIVNLLILCVLAFFWYNMTVVNNDINKTYPYKSDVIEWLN